MSPEIHIVWQRVRTFVQRHHPVMFISTVGILLALAVYSLYDVLTITFFDPSTAQSSIKPFDKKTVDKIKKLHISSDTTSDSLTFPSPRFNPFVE